MKSLKALIDDWFPGPGKTATKPPLDCVPFTRISSTERCYCRRTYIDGNRPEEILTNEVVYIVPEDIFIVGRGNNEFKIYRPSE